MDIKIGDFIKAKGLSYSGIVIGEGILGTRTPAWRVKGPRGEISAIPKSQAEFIAPDWEGTVTGIPLVRYNEDSKRWEETDNG